MIQQKSQAVLFPDFRNQHQKPAEEKKRAKADGCIEICVGNSAHKNDSLLKNGYGTSTV